MFIERRLPQPDLRDQCLRGFRYHAHNYPFLHGQQQKPAVQILYHHSHSLNSFYLVHDIHLSFSYLSLPYGTFSSHMSCALNLHPLQGVSDCSLNPWC